MAKVQGIVSRILRHVSRMIYAFFLREQPKKLRLWIIGGYLNLLRTIKLTNTHTEFLAFLMNYRGKSYSQFKQDLFVLFISKNWPQKTFMEIGVGDGIEISNTYLLESQNGWEGVLIEPNREFVDSIRKSRSARHIEAALTTRDIGEVEFFTGKRGVFASLLQTESVSEEASYRVKSIPVSKVFSDYKRDDLSFLSLDIEGNEDEIIIELMKMDCKPFIIIVEHNYDLVKSYRIEQSLKENSYKLLLRSISEVDYWFVRSDKINL